MLGTGMRLEEVLCLCPTDVQMMVTGFKQELKKAGVQLFVGKTKTDVCRQGNMKMLTGELLMHGVTRYLETAGLTDGNKLDAFTAVAPMFRATRRSNKTKKTELIKVRLELIEGVTHVHNAKHITNAVIQANFKALQKLATPNSTPTALHGCRAYFATALKSSGSSELHIKKLGGWASDCFLRYLHSYEGEDIKCLDKVHESIFGKK
jgi:hypothetical protein